MEDISIIQEMLWAHNSYNTITDVQKFQRQRAFIYNEIAENIHQYVRPTLWRMPR